MLECGNLPAVLKARSLLLLLLVGTLNTRDGQMKPREALSFSAKWFTKGLISGGLICSQYHLVAKECKTSRYITDRGVKSRGQKVKVLP